MRFFTRTRCIDGRLWRHDPMYDDPDLETEIGECEVCQGKGIGLNCADCDEDDDDEVQP